MYEALLKELAGKPITNIIDHDLLQIVRDERAKLDADIKKYHGHSKREAWNVTGGQCWGRSINLVRRLRSLGYEDARIASGYYNNRPGAEVEGGYHCWVVVGDNIIDITADQFLPHVGIRTFIRRKDDPRYVEDSRRSEEEEAMVTASSEPDAHLSKWEQEINNILKKDTSLSVEQRLDIVYRVILEIDKEPDLNSRKGVTEDDVNRIRKELGI